MKRLLATLSLIFLLPIIACAAGCKQSKWVEVQSITYTTEKNTTTLTSECKLNTTEEEIQQVEYDNAPEEQKNYGNPLPTYISIDRKDFIDSAKKLVGTTYYTYYSRDYFHPTEFLYYKITVNSYTLNYVKVKFISDYVLELDFKGEQKRVSTLSYDVTYFKN